MRRTFVIALVSAMGVSGSLFWTGTASAAKAVDNCAIVTPTDLQAIFGGTFQAGALISGNGSPGLRANGFPETGCVFGTSAGVIRPGTVSGTVGIYAVAGKAGAAAFAKAEKANKGKSTVLKGVGKKAFSLPPVPGVAPGIEVYVLDKQGFARVYASVLRYENTTTGTRLETPALAGQLAETVLGHL